MKKIILILCCFSFLLPLVLQSQNAPLTSTGRVTDAVPDDPSVPIAITVTDFDNIGQFTLTMKFDTTRVHYVSSSTNPALSGMTVTYTSPVGNTEGKLVFAWTGAYNVSLADGSSLADLTFTYVSGTGILSWAYTFGSVCQYKSYIEDVLTILNDTPEYLYYLNGGISNRAAPVTFMPDIANPATGTLAIPVMVNGFTNIGTLTLYLEYDPDIITFQNSYTVNPAFTSEFEVGDNSGTGDNRVIVMQWFGAAVSLADSSTLCTLDFTYPLATCDICALSWFDNGSSCEYTDGPGEVLIDMPQLDYYKNGIIYPGLPLIWTGNISNAWDDAGNWDACGIPDITRDIIIPDVAPNSFPIVTVDGYCESIRIETGASVTILPTGSITIGSN